MASRKFSVFINLLVGHIHLRAFGSDERKSHSIRTRPLTLQQDASHARQNQLTDGVPTGGRLRS
jgi:hypothetical protein